MQDKIIKKFPYYVKDAYKVGIYPGINEPVPALSIGSYLLTHKNAKDEMTYLLAKLIAENTKMLAGIHPSGLEWNLDTVQERICHSGSSGGIEVFQ